MFFSFLNGVSTMQKEVIITLKIQKDTAMPLIPLVNGFVSLNQSIGDFVAIDKGMGEVSLSLQSVEKGSDIFNFLVTISSLLPINDCIQSLNGYFELWKNIKDIKNKNIKEVENIPILTEKMVANCSDIVSLHNYGDTTINITNNFNQSNIIIDNETAPIYQESLECIKNIKGFNNKKEQVKTIYHNMLITFYQTTNTQKDIKHKAYCEALSSEPKGIFLDDKKLKDEMLENPYNYNFLVDLEVYVDSKGKIINYRAFNYKDKILKADNE